MLHAVVHRHRDRIVRLVRRELPTSVAAEPDDDIELFLSKLGEALRAPAAPSATAEIMAVAARRGRELQSRGWTPSSVVQRYGSVCEAITDVAAEEHAVFSAAEVRVLNNCIDLAIAAAMDSYTREAQLNGSREETRRLGEAAHELRDLINTGMLALHHVARGGGDSDGRYLAMLGRSLVGLQYVVDSMVSGVRLASAQHVREQVDVSALMDHLALIAALHAEYRGIEFRVERDAAPASIDGDAQLLASAVMNLLHNAFKNTHKDGHVMLRWRYPMGRAVIDIEDECGGMPQELADPFNAFGDRRGRDRQGLGLGLSMAREAVRVHGGDITVKNLPGKGCIFTIELPLAPPAASPAARAEAS